MGPNSLPLISAASVTAALAQRPAAAVEGPAALTPASSAATQIIEAKVESVSAKTPGYELTLSSGKQSLVVNSEIPLPVGTRLTLQVPVSTNEQSQAVPQNQTPPSAPTPTSSTPVPTLSNAVPGSHSLNIDQPNTAPALGNQTTANAPIPQPAPEQTAPIKTATPTPSLAIKVLSIVLPAAADSSPKSSGLLQQFMAARVPLLTNQLAPVAADSASTYLKPALANAMAAATATSSTATTKMAAPVLTLLNQLAPASIGKELPASVTSGGQNLAAISSANLTNTAATVSQQPLAPNIPKPVTAILQTWQQQLPTAAELSKPEGVAQAIKNSGVQYESQVFKTLASMLTKQNNEPLNESAPAQLFKSLWQKAASLSTAIKNPAALNSAAAVDSKSDNLTSTTNPAAINISQALQAVKAKLEAPLNTANTESAASTATATPTPTLLSALLGSDHKAVISRALITWSRLIQKIDSAPMPVRSLPMTPQQDVPETFRLLQTALAQTETEQAQRLNQSDNWQLNIPLFYRDGDMTREVRMHLSKEEQNNSAEGTKKTVRWRLRLHFDLQQLGPLDVDLELQWPALSATFWSEQQQALGLLNKELQPLRKTLTDMGVMVEELQARHGQLPEPSRNVISSRLIDTHS